LFLDLEILACVSLRASEQWKALDNTWQEIICLLRFCHERYTRASGRKDRKQQKTAICPILRFSCTVPLILVNYVATEAFGFDRPELGMLWYRILIDVNE
jgi:hypothetical protein